MNLPFSLDDNGLFNLFRSTNPKSAHVNNRKYGAKSRGVGFVEYENQAGQQNAIATMNGYMVEDGPEKPARKIEVVVSQTHAVIPKTETSQQ
jgi:RNA recognition motif-containing protein